MKIISFLATLLFAAAIRIQAQEPVVDTDGNPLLASHLFYDVKYYIMPVNYSGGLTPYTVISPVEIKCPLGITPYSLTPMPVTFSVPINQGDSVKTNDTVFISFSQVEWPFCTQFSKMFEVDEPSTEEEPPVLLSGYIWERNSRFKIEKEGGANTYKLTTFAAGTVGSKKNEFGTPVLVATNDMAKTLLVKFQKVNELTTTASFRVDKLGRKMFPSY